MAMLIIMEVTLSKIDMIQFRRLIICIFLATCALLAEAQVTAIVATKDSGLSSQTWFTTGKNGEMRENDIKNNWNYDRYITAAGYTSNGWFIAMSKGVTWTNQSCKTSSSWPDSYVHEQKEKGYMITSLASSDSRWLIVTSQGTSITDQQICSAPWSSLKDWIKGWWDKDYYITSIACQNSLWTVVMSKGSGVKYTNQSYFGADSTSELKNKIKEKWDEGYLITSLEYGNGSYLCVMSKYPGSTGGVQSWIINTDFEKDLKQRTEEGYLITYIGG